jgi:O-antigen ligase
VLQIGLVFSLPIIYIQSNDEQINLEKVIKFLGVITIFIVFYILFSPKTMSMLFANKRDNIPDYISVGEWVLLIYILLLSSPKLVHIFSSIILFYFLLQVGGRGNVLIATLITSIYFIVWVINKNKKRVVFFAIIVLMIIANFYFNKANSFSDRITPLTSFKLDQSLNERFAFAKKSLDFFSEKPIFGSGIGSFGSLFGLGDVRAYPHNIFLETAVECGIIGLVLIICVFLCVFKDLWLTTISFRLTMFLILLAFIGSLQYTNTFTESKIAFASFGIIQAYLNNYKREFIV